jgi:hypothetical protein
MKQVKCEHSICKQCIQNKDKNHTIKCNVCKTISQQNSIDVQLSKDTQELVAETFLDKLKILKSKNKPKLEHLRSTQVQ